MSPEAQEPVAQTQKVEPADDSLILKLLPGYVSDSWRLLGPAERKEAFRRVLRYYGVLILPIALAAGAVFARARGLPARQTRQIRVAAR